MYKINFNHLHYFLTIAEEGSIVSASKKLNITQPALSHQLKLLEQDLGKKLFDRKGRRLVINENGEVVLEHASKIFRQSEEMLATLESQTMTSKNIVKIGVVPWISKSVVSSFLKFFLSKQNILTEVYEDNIEYLGKDLEHKQYDLILCDSSYHIIQNKNFSAYPIGSTSIICIASPQLSIKSGKNFGKNLKNHKIISYLESSSLRNTVDNFLGHHDLKDNIIAEYTSIDMIINTLLNGRYVSFVPLSSVRPYLKNKQIKKIGNLTQNETSLWVITNRGLNEKSLIFEAVKKFKA
jgi:LysR family transcriptional activator of nhaA